MANREKGEATFKTGGDRYTLAMNMHAWALAQDALCKGDHVPSIERVQKRLAAGHFLTIEAVFWAALQKHHPDVTVEQATDLMGQSASGAAEALRAALAAATPETADVRELERNPPKAQGDKRATRAKADGAGDGSTSTPVPLA